MILTRTTLKLRAIPALARVASASAVSGRRSYTNVNMYSESDVNPITLHKFMQARDRSLREFLEDEADMVASESFQASTTAPKVPLNGAEQHKDINEQFAKQIGSLLHPSYGSE